MISPGGGRYFDTVRSGGIMGRANTLPNRQNARFQGSMVMAKKKIKKGEEVFLTYSTDRVGRAHGVRSGRG